MTFFPKPNLHPSIQPALSIVLIQYFSDDKTTQTADIEVQKLCDLSNDGRLVDYNNDIPLFKQLASYLGLSDEQEEDIPTPASKPLYEIHFQNY